MTLFNAHLGYAHQDLVCAYALAASLLANADIEAVESDRKLAPGDRFDDLTLAGQTVRRAQVKAHAAGERRLGLADLTTERIRFRLDKVITSALAEATPANEYRVVVTFGAPDASLDPFVRPAPGRRPFLPGLATERFTLDVDAIWPDDAPPAWPVLARLDRSAFVRFAEVFVIETGCPASSGNLSEPGPLERQLSALVEERLGAGRPPNQHRAPLDVVAQLIQFAHATRIEGARRTSGDVLIATGLVSDFGRVEERLPLDPARLVNLDDATGGLEEVLQASPRLVVVGPPGIGKSWLLHQLGQLLSDAGWVVATHYCFIDLLDAERERRGTIDATFGSLIAELLDADPSLRTDEAPRFAAGPRELEAILRHGTRRDASRRIAIIVDGLDHVDRPGAGQARRPRNTAADIIEELAAVELPDGAVMVVGSQPGEHLDAMLGDAAVHQLSRWGDDDIEQLARRAGVPGALVEAGLEGQTPAVLGAIRDAASGNPLYATYLARTACRIASGDLPAPPGLDIPGYLAEAPPFQAYYSWLLEGLAPDTGARFFAQLLSLVDFPVTARELAEITSAMAHLVPEVLARLGPVLAGDPDLGGVRVYHESFQRFVLSSAPNIDRAAVLAPVIDWLYGRGLFADTRAFRSLLPAMRAAGRDAEVVGAVEVDFASKAAEHCQPGDAVLANLGAAADAAAALGSFPDLARLVEVARAADNLWAWRLDVEDDLAEAFGAAFAAMSGAPALAERLLHDGRCTFRPRPGLLLCRLCDEAGVDAPWEGYLRAYDHQRETDSTSYPTEAPHAMARLVGRYRLAGRGESIARATAWLSNAEPRPVHPYDIVLVLGEMYGPDAVHSVVEALGEAPASAWARAAAAALAQDASVRRQHADAALRAGLPADGVRLCLGLGGDAALVDWSPDIDALTEEVLTREVRLRDDLLVNWLAALDVAAGRGEDGALFRVENRIPPDTWYRRWLRFAVALRRDLPSETVLADLRALADDVDIYRGDPRVVDLYSVHEEIRQSFSDALGRFDDDLWPEAAAAIARIGSETSSWLQRSRSGPLPVDAFLELVLDTADTEPKQEKASDLAAELLAPGALGGEFYDTHAEDQFLLARVHMKARRWAEAEQAWAVGCRYLAGYGWRKDITVYEVADPVAALCRAAPSQAPYVLKELQPVVEGVLVHTDGKETRHAVHQWLDSAARFHPAGGLLQLARETLSGGPSFGGLDHALPEGLSSLADELPGAMLVAGWIGAGEKARSAPGEALSACEKALSEGCDWARVAWTVVVASLGGDGVGSAKRAASAVAESADRVGRDAPAMPPDASDRAETDRPGDAIGRVRWQTEVPPEGWRLPQGASSMQIAHAVRGWRDEPRGTVCEAVVNAVGWRLVEMARSGREPEAAALIRRIAHDARVWESDDILAGLAAGLERHRAVRLAALASTLAYTRARDGWRRFGGEKAQALFVKAAALAPEVAWSTLAEEVADAVASGGAHGVTVHMIELLASEGRGDDAFAAWSEALKAISHRLPPTGPADDVNVPYEASAQGSEWALGCAVTARMNHALIEERRAATAGTALFVTSADAAALARLIDFAVDHAPVPVLIAALDATFRFEPPPFDAARFAEASLRRAATSDYASARVLARRLLRRVGIEVAVAAPPALMPVPALDDESVKQLRRMVGERRIAQVEEVWPDFGRTVAERLEVVFRSDDFGERMRSALWNLRPERPGARVSVWLLDADEIERALQTTASAARGVLAAEGILDPAIEDEVGSALLCELELGVRATLSRTPRPADHPAPTSLSPSRISSEPRAISGGEFEGWVLLAYHEEELVLGDGYEKTVESRREVWSGLQFGGSGDFEGRLPVGYGLPAIWLDPAPSGASAQPFRGAAAGLEIIRDYWGAFELLAPHPTIVLASGLRPAPFTNGLVLVDRGNEPAVVARIWRGGLLGDEYISDREHRLSGIDLLVRPDVLEAAAGWAPTPATYVTTATAKRTPAD